MSEANSRDKKFLFQENSAIFALLPLVGRGLFREKQKENPYLKMIAKQVHSVENTRSIPILREKSTKVHDILSVAGKRLLEQKKEASLDENKSLLLSMTFGRTYLEALDILSYKESIRVLVYSKMHLDEPLVKEIGTRYLEAQFELLRSHQARPVVMVKVTLSTLNCPHTANQSTISAAENEIVQRIDFLQSELVLQEMGFSLTERHNKLVLLETQGEDTFFRQSCLAEIDTLQKELEKKKSKHLVTREESIVDLKSWYCSCNAYQHCYLQNYQKYTPAAENDLLEGSLKALSFFVKDASQMVANAATNKENLVARFLCALPPEIQTKHLSTLPLCPHLLALVLALANPLFSSQFIRFDYLDNLASLIR